MPQIERHRHLRGRLQNQQLHVVYRGIVKQGYAEPRPIRRCGGVRQCGHLPLIQADVGTVISRFGRFYEQIARMWELDTYLHFLGRATLWGWIFEGSPICVVMDPPVCFPLLDPLDANSLVAIFRVAPCLRCGWNVVGRDNSLYPILVLMALSIYFIFVNARIKVVHSICTHKHKNTSTIASTYHSHTYNRRGRGSRHQAHTPAIFG